MKRCPTCNKTYHEQNLSFCIDDGTPLGDADVVQPDSEATIVSPSAQSDDRNAATTQPYGPKTPPSDRAPAYQPPGSFPQASGRGNAWPWVVAVFVVVLIGVAGLGISAAIFIPKLMRAAADRNARGSNLNANRSETDRGLNSNSNGNTAKTNDDSNNANVAVPNANAGNKNNNINSAADDATGPPTNPDKVLADLTDLENDWTVANINADKKTLERILADDYVGKSSDGTAQGKAEYIRTIQPDGSIGRWDFEDLKVDLRGDRATLGGLLKLQLQGQAVSYRFTDKFVWRDARWQAISSEVSRVK